jgi:hypothetical protein
MDMVVMDKNLMVQEVRLGLQVMDPTSGMQCTHNFNMSTQQLQLLLAGWSFVGYLRNTASLIMK